MLDNLLDRWKHTIYLSLLAPPLAFRADRTYQKLPQLPSAPPRRALPMLSIIVPARNEAHNLRTLLPSLEALDYPGQVEVIVVDDNSEDETAVVAESFGARVIRLRELPADWLGKPYALCHGASAARGDWLLFTDADTIHQPHGPAQAVQYALEHNLDGVSLFLDQQCRGVTDRLALTAAFAGMFTAWQPASTHLNGQYILLRRQVYEESGGFTAVRHEALEDLALGRYLRQKNYRVQMMRGEHAAQVRMYQTRTQMWHGMNRLGSQTLRFSGSRALWTIFFITITMNPLLVLLAVLGRRVHRIWLPLTWGAVALSFWPWARRFGSGWYALISPFGALVVQLAGAWGLVRRLLGRGIHWKGRTV
ncbi:MAG: glycosyltransferase [Anaerolineales bacterium]|nr:glycosyltransferase [Anaerolineales bacterium]